MTYDNNIQIRELAENYNFEMRPVAMKSTHHAKMTELLIGRDLSWLDERGHEDKNLTCFQEKNQT